MIIEGPRKSVALPCSASCGINLAVFLLLVVQCVGQSNPSCPVLPTLASVKTGWSEKEGYSAQNTIAIWYLNQGKKAIRGAEFKLMMLDAVGNQYPAHKLVIVNGTVKPQKGDFAWADNQDEKEAFGPDWQFIEGVEVRVVRVMYSDLSVWTPLKEGQCGKRFMNNDYDSALDRRNKEFCAHDKPPVGKSEAYLAGWKSAHDAICQEKK